MLSDKVPFFSIGIPVWKTAYLKEAVTSVLSQTSGDFELIIVDDASPDPVDEIVNLFNDERINFYRNKTNLGAANLVDNWNKCLGYARGTYFMLLGDDDKLEPDCLHEFASLIGRWPDLNVYHCRSAIINEKSEYTGFTESRPEFELVYDAIWHRMRGFRTQFISDYVYRREELVALGGFFKLPMGWASDDISAYRAMMYKGIAHTQKPVFCYRQNAASMSMSGSVYSKLNAITGEHQWYETFLQQEPLDTASLILRMNISRLLPNYIRNKQMGTIALWARWTELLRYRQFKNRGVSAGTFVLSVLLKIQYIFVRIIRK